MTLKSRQRALTVLVVAIAILSTPILYRLYDHWRWQATSDADLIQSIAASLPESAHKGRKIAVISNDNEQD